MTGRHRLTPARAWQDYLDHVAVEDAAWELPQVQAAVGANAALPHVWRVAAKQAEQAWNRWRNTARST